MTVWRITSRRRTAAAAHMDAGAAAATEYSAKSPLALACAVRSCSLGGVLAPPPHGTASQVGQITKTHQKIVRLTDNTCLCNSLTNYEYVVHTMTGNGNYVNLLKN